MSLPTPTPFKIAVSDDLLAFINDRVRTGRLPAPLHHEEGDGWSHGLPLQTLSALKSFWTNEYDWRLIEARLNATFKQFTLPISAEGEDLSLHFVHHRSSREDAVPLLFVHGWPGSFLEVEHILPLLTEPASPKHQAFHVVAPSLPGFGFSSAPKNAGFTPKKFAAVLNKLMLALGYTTYIAQGGDWGSMISRLIGINHPESCVAIHVNFLVATPPSVLWNPLEIAWLVLRRFTDSEKEKLKRMMWWQEKESGYYKIMGTKPMTVSYALVDSPLGMLAWIREKLEPLVDEYTWTEEECITWAMVPSPSSDIAPTLSVLMLPDVHHPWWKCARELVQGGTRHPAGGYVGPCHRPQRLFRSLEFP